MRFYAKPGKRKFYLLHMQNLKYLNFVELKTVSVAVMDGITLGHPCCAVHNCKVALTTSRDRFCKEHRVLNAICAIKDCRAPIAEGKCTCEDPLHQEIKHIHCVRGQAQFQLQEHLKRARVAHPNDAIAEDIDLSTIADEDDNEEQFFELGENSNNTHPTPTKPRLSDTPILAPKKRIAAQFGRKRTHNEQILVAPCGIIFARETFYGAKGIATCAVSTEDYNS